MNVFCAYDELVSVDDLKPNPRNPNQHPEEQIELLAKIIKYNGWRAPITVSTLSGYIVRGHGRLQAAIKAGIDKCPVDYQDYESEEAEIADLLADNRIAELSFNDDDALQSLLDELNAASFDLELAGYDNELLDELSSYYENEERKTLSDMFVVPPFSILDTRQGYWQQRKKEWTDLGIKSEVGRDEELICNTKMDKSRYAKSGFSHMAPSTSVFDPVLCEVAYSWFCPTNGKILDPFAGGSVRGIVADKMGFDYTGIDLRQEQVNANKINAKELGLSPTWICDDSLNVDDHIEKDTIDFVFSCPPYADLEVYSDDPRDISNMDYKDFISVYSKIIKKACAKLKDGRFACFVVSEVRGKDGKQRGFVFDTIKAFKDAGLELYNEMVLCNVAGTAGLRAARQFSASRKVVRTHQNVLVFVKGNVKDIKEAFPVYDLAMLSLVEGE